MQEHVWITPEFSVRKETLCFRQKTAPALGADYKTAPRRLTGAFCLLGKHHAGKCKFTADPDVRLYGFREGRP